MQDAQAQVQALKLDVGDDPGAGTRRARAARQRAATEREQRIAVDTATMIITRVDLINSGSDMNQMLPMHEQHQERYARCHESGWPMGALPSTGTSNSLKRAPPKYSPRWSHQGQAA